MKYLRDTHKFTMFTSPTEYNDILSDSRSITSKYDLYVVTKLYTMQIVIVKHRITNFCNES